MRDLRCSSPEDKMDAESAVTPSDKAEPQKSEKSYKLYTKQLDPDIWHNVMRFYSPRFNVHNLIAPIKLVRDVPKPATGSQREKKKITNSSTEGGQVREGLDYSKLAPYGNAIKNRQNLFRKMTRTYQMSHSEAIEAELRYKDKSMARYPWKFSDFESPYHYVGTLEGNQDSTYVLLKMIKDSNNGDAFNIIPVKRWYKFIPKPWYRKVIEAKADESTPPQKSSQPQAASKQPKIQSGDSLSTTEKERKSWETRFMDVQQEVIPRKRGRVEEDDDEGLDYEEEFADDEEINLGIEDAEDQKEALGRQFGKYSKKFSSRGDYSEDGELYSMKPRSVSAEDGFTNKLRRSLDYKDDDSVDETFIFSDGEDYNPYRFNESKSEPYQGGNEKKSKQEDQQQSQTQKNKKLKKEHPTLFPPKKKTSSLSPITAGVISDNSQRNVATTSSLDTIKKVRNEDSEAVNATNPTTKSSSAVELLKMLSKNPPTKPLDGIKRSSSQLSEVPLSQKSMSANSDSREHSPTLSPKLQKSPSDPREGPRAPIRRTEGLGARQQKKKFVTEEDVINIYAKQGLCAIKAKDLANELVLMCENNAKSKEHLKSLLNMMVKSEGGMLHLLPKYRKTQ